MAPILIRVKETSPYPKWTNNMINQHQNLSNARMSLFLLTFCNQSWGLGKKTCFFRAFSSRNSHPQSTRISPITDRSLSCGFSLPHINIAKPLMNSIKNGHSQDINHIKSTQMSHLWYLKRVQTWINTCSRWINRHETWKLHKLQFYYWTK